MIRMNDIESQKNMALCLRLTIDYLENYNFHYVIHYLAQFGITVLFRGITILT